MELELFENNNCRVNINGTVLTVNRKSQTALFISEDHRTLRVTGLMIIIYLRENVRKFIKNSLNQHNRASLICRFFARSKELEFSFIKNREDSGYS
jgi:hypothetical protein